MKREARDAGEEFGSPLDTQVRVGTRPKLGRYELGRELGRGTTGVVYEAWDGQSRSVVALKTLTAMDAENLFRLKHEFRSLANLEHENFVRFGELGCEGGRWFFTMERVDGVDWLAHARPLGAPRGYDEARLREVLAQLVEGLAALHEAGRIHRDVKPSNVLVSTEGRVVLLDFGLASAMGAGAEMSGTPLYMAPEQIGCEPLTAAADWYAVGVMLHVALTGRAPFEHADIAELLSAKLSEEAPRGWGEGAPQDLVSLATALMAREASERPGIEEIRRRLGLAAPSAQVRTVFVGRRQELDALGAALERAKTQATQVVVRGEPGMGKSALVERFLSELPAQAVVLRGRCYEQESVPFGGADSLIDALSEYLMGLASSDADRLLAGGATGAATMFPVLYRVPSLSRKRADAPMVSPTRLREQAFAELARVAQALGLVRTLVVYVDDLHWADPDSMALMQAVFVGGGARCLFVATQRSGDRGAAGVESFVRDFEAIEITSLGAEDSQALCAALTTTANEATLKKVLQESAGHPLFLSELVRSARMGKLERHANARLEDVLWDRVADRDEIERPFLRMLALAGAPTPYAVIAQAAGLDVGECQTRLSALRAAQLVRVSRDGEERCVEPYHDRIRAAVMERVKSEGAEALAQAHVALGRALLASAGDEELPSRIFAIVQHLNAGRARIAIEAERRRLAELNLVAAREAYRATAFERSHDYAAAGIECVDVPSEIVATWRDLHVVRFQAEYVLGRQGDARATFDRIKASLDPIEAAPAYCAMIDCCVSDNPATGLRLAGEALERLRSPLSKKTTKAHILAEFLAARAAQGGRRPQDLDALPDVTDPRIAAVMQVLTSAVAAAFMVDENLMPWIMLRLARLSMRYGLSNVSSYGIAGYGLVFSGVLGRYETGQALGELAMRLEERFKNRAITARVSFVVNGFIASWVAPWAKTLEGMTKTYELAARYGDTTYECSACGCLMFLMFGAGGDLATLAQKAEWARTLSEQRGVLTQARIADAVERYAAALQGRTGGLQDLGLPRQGYDEFRRSLNEEFVLTLALLHVARGELAILAGDSRRAREHCAEVEKRKHVVVVTPIGLDYTFVRALTEAKEHDAAPLARRLVHVRRVYAAWKQLATRGRGCPANFEPQALIVKAELQRILGQSGRALRTYAQAMESARAHGSDKRYAIAAELASDFARARGDAALATRYRREAIDGYRRWGATAKADLLEADVSTIRDA